MQYTIDPIQPYGAVITNRVAGATIEQFDTALIYKWVQQYRIIIFRNFRLFDKNELALYGQKIGEPLQWVFGAINELKVKADAQNYIYTNREVPFHWDGAFTGKIPYLILFQCLKAPLKEHKGGTTFVDTIKLLQDTPPEVLREWKNITITYRTEKIVHYGGKITQPLIAQHPVTGEEVMRYAEPVTDLNPVTLDIHGYPEAKQQDFIQDMQQRLYDTDYCYTHYWEDGDIVIADNHTLLHGREAFTKSNDRHIQRINILHRSGQNSMARYIKNSLTIRRKEFFVAELPIFIIPVLLSAGNWEVFASLNFWLGMIAGFLLFNIGDIINCYADRRVDAIYKSHLSNAVFELGKRHVIGQIILSGIIALILTSVVAVNTDRLYLIPLTLAGCFIGIQYSVGPFHFKTRGMWQLLCLWGIIFWGPMLYISIITDGFPAAVLLTLFAAYGFHQMGIILLNTAEDYTEDKQAGLNTIIISLGLHRAMRFALTLIFISGLGIQVLFILLFAASQLPWYLYPAILLLTVGWLRILSGFQKIVKKIDNMDEDTATNELKKNGMMVPKWLKTGAYTSLAVSLVFFMYRLYLHLYT